MQFMAALLFTAFVATTGTSEPEQRRQLTYETLMQAQTIGAPSDLAGFSPPAGAQPPSRVFAGRLSFRARGSHEVDNAA